MAPAVNSGRRRRRAAHLMSAVLVLVAAGMARVAAAPADGMVESLGSFTDGLNYVRKYVLVDKRLTEAQLIRLAKRLHAEEPRTWFWLFDDKSKFPVFWATVRNTEHGDVRDYPLDWVRDHTVGHIGLQLRPHAPTHWVLMRGRGADVLQELGND